MPSLVPRRRRDPRWEEDGPAARHEHRRRRIRGLSAFAFALIAAAAAAVVWCLQLGLFGAGFHVGLRIG